MSKCPFAQWKPIGRSSGAYKGGDYRIVHHTTEGSSAEGAFAAYLARHVTPHFTVDDKIIYQHHDTERAASAVLNRAGGVETNRWSAIQIEVVGFAGKAKKAATLENVARLCRWLEAEHDIPPVWPAGLPRWGAKDPGGHNRDPRIWKVDGGHYGHSQVPENSHWDPAYRPDELAVVMGGTAAPAGKPFVLLIDGRDVTTAAGATLENGSTRIHCALKTLSEALGWDVRYNPAENRTEVGTAPRSR